MTPNCGSLGFLLGKVGFSLLSARERRHEFNCWEICPFITSHRLKPAESKITTSDRPNNTTQYAKHWWKTMLHSFMCIVLASLCLWTCSLCKYELLLVANGRLFLLVVTKKKMYQYLKMPMDSYNCSIVVCSFFQKLIRQSSLKKWALQATADALLLSVCLLSIRRAFAGLGGGACFSLNSNVM